MTKRTCSLFIHQASSTLDKREATTPSLPLSLDRGSYTPSILRITRRRRVCTFGDPRPDVAKHFRRACKPDLAHVRERDPSQLPNPVKAPGLSVPILHDGEKTGIRDDKGTCRRRSKMGSAKGKREGARDRGWGSWDASDCVCGHFFSLALSWSALLLLVC